MELCLEAEQATISGACSTRPKVIILETSANVLSPSLRPWWIRLQKIILSQDAYLWEKQVICPKKDLGKLTPRERLFVVGKLCDQEPEPIILDAVALPEDISQFIH